MIGYLVHSLSRVMSIMTRAKHSCNSLKVAYNTAEIRDSGMQKEMKVSFFLMCPRLTSDDVVSIILLSFGSIVLARVPVLGVVFYPFQLFGVFIHEVCHGVLAILTGGEFRRFTVYYNRSGLAWSSGGVRWIVVSAGYVGTAIAGGLLIMLAASNVSANGALSILGASLALVCVIFARNLFGFAMGIGIALLLFLAGRHLTNQWADLLLLFLAVQTSLNALNSLFNLVRVSRNPTHTTSDAETMQQLTGLPAPFWAVVWVIIAIAVLMLALTVAYCPETFSLLLSTSSFCGTLT